MSDNFERYHCQMALPGFGENAQQQLNNAKVLIVGMGGLGCPAAQYLVAAGIGTVGLVDDDVVSERNLHRQILFSPADIGRPKVEVAARRLEQQNPSIKIVFNNFRVLPQNVMELVNGYDLIVDCTDNFDTRYLLNDACVLAGKPLVYGAIYRYEGQMAVLNVLLEGGSYSANYRDIYPQADSLSIPNCADGGVIPTLAGMVGCMQAGEVLKYFTARQDLLIGKLCIINTQRSDIYQIELRPDKARMITKLPVSIDTLDYENLRIGDYTLVDVRSASERENFNIGGLSIPLDGLAGQLAQLPLSKPIVCYCASGKRSWVAAKMIKEAFPTTVVYSLKGGVERIHVSDSIQLI